MKLIYYITFCILLVACSKGDNQIHSGATTSSVFEVVAADSVFDINTNKDTSEIIKYVYVISIYGAQVTHEESRVNDIQYGYGTRLGIIGEDFRAYKLRNKYSIDKDYAKEELSIPLDSFELNEGSMDHDTTKSFEVSIVSKEKFYQMQKTSINHFTKDSIFKKSDTTLNLKINNGFKTFIDEGEDSYYYLGQFKSLNAYLILFSCGKCEESEYLLIDKKTGATIEGFPSFPYFSNNKQTALTMYVGFDDAGVRLNLYRKNGGATKGFPYWMPVKSIEGFWGKDDYFYVPVLPSIVNWENQNPTKEREGTDYNFRYVKIKVK
jgi:hypothetical protein